MKWQLLLLVGFLQPLVPTVGHADSTRPIPVELWHTGDDGLSQKLFQNIEDAFKRSPMFSLDSENKTGALVVSIPTNAEWKRIGRRTRVLYTVEFSSKQRGNLAVRHGSCWDREMNKCAARIVKDATIAARKLQKLP